MNKITINKISLLSLMFMMIFCSVNLSAQNQRSNSKKINNQNLEKDVRQEVPVKGKDGVNVNYDARKDHALAGFLVSKEVTTEGVIVSKVFKGSSGYDAGIQEGDIITRINAIYVKDSGQFWEEMKKYEEGDAVLMTWRREDMVFQEKIVLKKTITREFKEGQTQVMDRDRQHKTEEERQRMEERGHRPPEMSKEEMEKLKKMSPEQRKAYLEKRGKRMGNPKGNAKGEADRNLTEEEVAKLKEMSAAERRAYMEEKRRANWDEGNDRYPQKRPEGRKKGLSDAEVELLKHMSPEERKAYMEKRRADRGNAANKPSKVKGKPQGKMDKMPGKAMENAKDMLAKNPFGWKAVEEAGNVVIKRVVDGGMASKLGIQAGDVITKINKVNVSSLADLEKVGTPAKKLKLKYLRDGKKMKAKANIL